MNRTEGFARALPPAHCRRFRAVDSNSGSYFPFRTPLTTRSAVRLMRKVMRKRKMPIVKRAPNGSSR